MSSDYLLLVPVGAVVAMVIVLMIALVGLHRE